MPEPQSIYILAEESDRRVTGGQKYDHYIFKSFEQCSSSVKYLTDDMFLRSRVPFLYNLIYLRLLFIGDMRMLILDSRMYTRSLFILMLMRCFRPSVRIISIHHHFNYQARQLGVLRPFDRMLELGFLHCCHYVIVPSPFTRDLSERHALQEKIVFLPIGFSNKAGEDRQVDKARAGGEPAGTRVFLYLGSVNRRKGMDLLIRSMAMVRQGDWHLNIAGSYREDRYYKMVWRIILKNGLEKKISFLGRVEEQRITDLFRSADCFLLPSRYEGFGMVIAEAFSYGLPVIAFDNSAMPYLIKNGKNGILVKDGDHRSFAGAIESMLGPDPKREAYHEHALQTYRDLPTLKEMQDGMRTWIKKLLKQ